jgi:hypothetical protein
MAFKRIIKKLYMEPVTVTGNAVGTGDATTVLFALDHHTIQSGSLTVYLDGVETTDYTADLAAGEITFTTAPGTGVAITADYTAGYDSTVLTATGETVVIGLQVANVGAASAAAVTVQVGDIRQCNAIPVPINAAISPIAGKLVLVADDTLHVTASADAMLELSLSYMEV